MLGRSMEFITACAYNAMSAGSAWREAYAGLDASMLLSGGDAFELTVRLFPDLPQEVVEAAMARSDREVEAGVTVASFAQLLAAELNSRVAHRLPPR